MSNIKGLRIIILGVLCLGLIFIVNHGQAMVEEDEDVGNKTQVQNMENLDNQPKSPEYAPDQLIVKLKEGSTPDDIKDLNAKYNVTSTEKVFQESASPQDTLKTLKDKLEKLSTTHDSWYWQMDKNSKEYKDYMAKIEEEKAALGNQIKAQEELITRLEQRQQRAPEGTQTPNLDNIYLLKTGQNANIQEMAKEYSANPNVEYAEPDYIVKVQMIPNDPYYASKGSWSQSYDDLWGLKKIQADKAWDITQGEGVVVAVVDTGIDYNHEDLAANIWINAGEIPNNGIDDDHDGYVDDVRGYDFAYKDNDPMDGYGHGTHCAGTIAAVGNNSKGIIGVAPKAKVMAVKGLDDVEGAGYNSDLADCLKYAADRGADVISNSWGGGTAQLLTDAVNYAYSKGCVIVAAAGNFSMDVVDTAPANITNVIAVSAFDPYGAKCYFSNYGTKIDVAAPGKEILSTMNDNSKIAQIRVSSGYYLSDGTSMACPHVAGVAALILAKTPSFDAQQVRYVLRSSADDVDVSGWDINSGYGRVNAYKALQVTNASKAVAAITSPVSGSTIKDKINIEGIATGVSYKLEYAKAATPIVYTLIGSGSKVDNGVLVSWDTTTIIEDGDYVLKITVTDANNLISEARVNLILDNKNLVISSPFDNDFRRAGDKIEIKGSARGYGFESYKIEYSQDKTNWILIKQDNASITDGVLAVWDTSFITAPKKYHLRLTGYYFGGKKGEATKENIYFDPTLHPGWPRWIYTPYAYASWFVPVIADLNKDGTQEIIVSSTNRPPSICILKADGTLVRTIELTNMRQGCIGAPAIGDVDNDGFDEIVVSAMDFTFDSKNYIFAYKYDGSMPAGWPLQIGYGNVDNSIVLSDLNLDGKLELIITAPQNSICVVSNKGEILLSPIELGGLHIWTNLWPTPAVGNFDDDPELEIVVVFTEYNSNDSYSGCIHVFNLDGTEVSGWPKRLTNMDNILVSPVVGDINHDGNLEIIVSGSCMNHIYGGGIYALDKNGNILSGWPVLTSYDIYSAALADFNNDGYLEIVVSGTDIYTYGNKTYILDYRGNVVSGWPKTSVWSEFYSPVVGDFNGDGKLDVINYTGDTIYARMFDGTDIVGFPKNTELGNSVPVVFGDIDNDGKIEIVASSGNNLRYKDEESRGSIYVWDLDAKYQPQYDAWPTFHHDNRRTGNCMPDITVLSPNGGEQLVLGQTYNIKWDYSGMGNVVTITLLAYNSDGSQAGSPIPIKTVDTALKSYNWVIPNSLTIYPQS